MDMYASSLWSDLGPVSVVLVVLAAVFREFMRNMDRDK